MTRVSNYGYDKRFNKDEYNINRKRRQKNTLTDAYNCGGFALGTFSWYYPYATDIVDYAYNHGFITLDDKNRILSRHSEESYEWDEEDFLFDYDGNKKEVGAIPVYECWRSMMVLEDLEDISNVFWKDSGYIEYFISKILEEIPNIRVINELSDLKENEYCVAFRVGRGDFHFIRSNNSKCTRWIGKCGWDKVHKLYGDFNRMFGDRYDGDTILFAKVM